MRRLRVTTPELVPLEFRLAGAAERGLAWMLDEVLLFVATVLLYLLATLFGLATLGFGLLPGFAIVVILRFALDLGYRWYAETRWRGRTWGKRIMSLRTVQANGTPPLAWQAFVRNAARPLDALPIGSLLGAVLITLDPEGRRAGDWLAGTRVIREVRHRPPRALRVLASEQNSLLQDPGAAARVRARVPEREAALLGELVAAAPRIETSRRLEITRRLAAHYRDALGLEAHRALPDEGLLRGIVGVLTRERFGAPANPRGGRR